MRKSAVKTLLPIIQALTVVLVLISMACKSAPAPTPAKTTTPTGGVTQASDTLSARADEAKRRAMDFEAPSYFPSEWEAAEAQYSTASGMYRSTASEIQEATAAFNQAAEAYDELFEKTIPLYAQAREDEIIAVRDEVIQTGFTDFLPEYLQNADKIGIAALEQYEAKDYYKAKDTAAEALKEYETLLTGAKVYSARQEIINRGFRDYDPENFDKADEIAQTAMDEYDAGNKEAAISSAEEALLRFNIVLTNGWTAYAAERRASAIAERERAIENKVNVAVRDGFREADTVFNSAEEDFQNEKFDTAANQFTDSEARFVIAGQETEEKRLRAVETIRLAEEKIEESVGTASEAEKIIEGGSR